MKLNKLQAIYRTLAITFMKYPPQEMMQLRELEEALSTSQSNLVLLEELLHSGNDPERQAELSTETEGLLTQMEIHLRKIRRELY